MSLSALVRRVAVFLAAAVTIVSCSDGTTSVVDTPTLRVVQMRPESASVAVGHVARFFVPGGGVTQNVYAGTIGGKGTSFGRIDDSTLVLIVPSISTGAAEVRVDIADFRGTATETIIAGEAIANPAEQITTALNAALSTTIATPKPAGYSGSWVSDSMYVAQQVAEAKAKISQLSAAEQLELARLLGAAGLGSVNAVGNKRATFLGGTPEDIACAEHLIGWTNDNRTAETTAGAALAVGTNAVRQFILNAAAVATYLKGVIAYAGVKNLCTLERDLELTSAPDAEGTRLEVKADRYTFIDADAVKNIVVERFMIARRNLVRVFDMLKKLFNWITGSEKVAAPEELTTSTKVAAAVPVEGDRVDLESTSVASTDGSKIDLSLLKRAGTQLVLKALTTVKAKFTTNLTLRVKRTEFADQVVTKPVTIEQVCFEGPLPTDVYFGSSCVASVAIAPAVTTLSVNGTVTLVPNVVGTDGVTLTNRTIRWKSSDETLAKVVNGVVTAIKAGGPVTITASAGPLTAPVNGTATVTVIDHKVVIAPKAVSIEAGKSQQFTATVTGTTNTAVTWTATGGTVSSSGLYSAGNVAGSFRVIATTAVTPAHADTAAITITPVDSVPIYRALVTGKWTLEWTYLSDGRHALTENLVLRGDGTGYEASSVAEDGRVSTATSETQTPLTYTITKNSAGRYDLRIVVRGLVHGGLLTYPLTPISASGAYRTVLSKD